MVSDPTHLLLAAADGDQPALHAFVVATQADVWRFCAHLVDQDTADDLTQDTYVQAVRSMHRFRGDGSARAWLLTIARRVCADHLRHVITRRERETTTSPDELPGIAGTATLDTTGEVVDLLANLPHEQREALVLTQVVGLSYAEAATTVGVPVGTIRSRVARARSSLVNLLDTDDHGESAVHSPLLPAAPLRM